MPFPSSSRDYKEWWFRTTNLFVCDYLPSLCPSLGFTSEVSTGWCWRQHVNGDFASLLLQVFPRTLLIVNHTSVLLFAMMMMMMMMMMMGTTKSRVQWKQNTHNNDDDNEQVRIYYPLLCSNLFGTKGSGTRPTRTPTDVHLRDEENSENGVLADDAAG